MAPDRAETLQAVAQQAILAAGGAAKLAAALGVSRSAPGKWDRVPARHVAAVSRITGIPMVTIRPDLFEVRA